MKSILTIVAFTLLFSLCSFSQVRNHRETIPDRPTAERLREIHKPNTDDLQGLNDMKSLTIKSKCTDWQTALRKPQKEFYEDKFYARDTRTTINKTYLNNGFLLVEEDYNMWDGSVWLNYMKDIYTYDGNNNCSEELHLDWNGVASWVNGYIILNSYDENKNKILRLFQDWDWNDSVWVNVFKNSFSYDVNSNIIERVDQEWYNSAWANSAKYSYTYNPIGKLVERLFQTGNGSGWMNYEKISYTYDENSNLVEELSYTWNDSSWVAGSKRSLTYDANNNMIQELFQYLDGSVWISSVIISYTYDGNNNLIEWFRKNWYGYWVNVEKNIFSYNAFKEQIEWIKQNWNASSWLNSEKELYTYDVNHHIIEQLSQNWDAPIWVNSYKYSYLFDINYNLSERLEQYWDGQTWVNNYKYLCTFVPMTSVDSDLNSVNSYSISNNFPNPFNPATNIQYAIGSRQFVQLKVFDVLGTEIETLVNEEKSAGKYELNWNAANLPSGVYFYRLQAGDFVQTRKMILLK